MLALIDGDIIAYQAVSAATKEIDWQDGEGPNTVADIAGAIDSACRLVEEWTRLAGCGRQAVMFSGRTGANFRKVIDPIRYKATRKDKPAGYWQIVDAVEAALQVLPDRGPGG
jgi:5'-3' exonuclease